MDKPEVIIFTPVKPVKDEAETIEALLSGGVADRVHLRHPEASEDDLAKILEKIPQRLRERISVHYFPALTAKYGCGLHLNDRCRKPPSDFEGVLSRSCHSADEINACAEAADYVTLSPVFPSISKEGYVPAFDFNDLNLPQNRHIIALGGVTPDKFNDLRKSGFAGVGLLGYVWQDVDSAIPTIIKSRKLAFDSHLQFITNATDIEGTVRQAKEALEGGCRWIQVRMKDAGIEEIATAARQIRALGDDFTLIVDDHVLLTKESFIDGVHVGQNDMSPSEARKILGPDKIIGLTINTSAQAVAARGTEADYVGTGPWRFTTTKKHLAPVLGADGISDIIRILRADNFSGPVVAIGGIGPDDVPDVLRTGADGVAISSAISRSSDPVRLTSMFISAINENKLYPINGQH